MSDHINDKISPQEGNSNGSREQALAEQLTELQKANEEIRVSRRAALNVMEDAILSKKALKESEEKYRTLFETIEEGFCIVELVRNEQGNVVDAIYKEVNNAFERHTGLHDIIGRKSTETIPNYDPNRFKFYQQLSETGKTLLSESYINDIDRWLRMYHLRIGGPGSDLIAAVFEDITDRKQREQQQDYLLRLNDAIRSLSDPLEIEAITTDLLGAHLDVNQAYYGEKAGDYIIINYAYTKGLAPMTGKFRYEDFGKGLTEGCSAGKVQVCHDAATDPALSGEERQKLAAINVAAYITYPFVKDGEWVATLAVQSIEPRQWKQHEIEIIRETAEHTWTAVERAKSEKALRRSEDLLQKTISIQTVGVLFFNLDGSITDCNAAFERMTGYTRAELLTKNLEHLTATGYMDITKTAASDLVASGETAPYEKELIRKDGSSFWTLCASRRLEENEKNAQCVKFVIDITERKRTEDALQKSEKRLQTLSDAVPQVIWTNDEKGKAVYFNERWYEYSGLSYSQSYEKGWEAIVHPDDALASIKKWKNALSKGKMFDTEYRLRRYDGVYRWFIGRNVPLKDESGKVISWFGSATDIEAFKQAQEALHISKARLKTTMDSAIDYAIITTDVNGNIEQWSCGAEKIFGYKESEVMGKTASLIFTPEDRAAKMPEKEMLTAAEYGRAIDERWHLRKDGSRFYASGVMSSIKDGGVTGYVKVARDMTRQKETEENLKVWEERYRIALQSAQMAAWDWDIEKDKIIWNDQHYYLLGLTPEHTSKKSAYFFQFLHADDVEKVKTAFEKAVNETGTYQQDFRIIRNDNGEERWMHGFGQVIRKLEERAVRMVGVMFDITERKLLEQQKDDFIAVASHELKTPVTSIKVYAALLDEIYRQGDFASGGLMVKKMNGQVERLIELINTLLDVSKIRGGRLELNKETFDLNALISERLEEMPKLPSTHKIVFSEEDVVMVNADRDRIGQVITNMISNAIKYSPKGGQVIIGTKKNQGLVEVSVQDEGIGIHEEFRKKVFERFYRVRDAQVSTFPGMGMGLFITTNIVHQHGGEVWVESDPGKGSVFYFTLPVNDETDARIAEEFRL